MPNLKRSALVPYPASAMYQLVNQIEEYPQFLPWCKSSQILWQDADEIRATLVLAKGGLQKSFTTCNRLQANKMIEISLIDGPLQHLNGFWRFEDLAGDNSKVMLDLEFEFSNKLLSMAFSPVFHQVTNTLVDAFCKRARAIYG